MISKYTSNYSHVITRRTYFIRRQCFINKKFVCSSMEVFVNWLFSFKTTILLPYIYILRRVIIFVNNVSYSEHHITWLNVD